MPDFSKYIEYLTINDASMLYFFSWLIFTFLCISYIYINLNRVGITETIKNILAGANYLIFIYGVFILILYTFDIVNMYAYKWELYTSIPFIIHGYVITYYSAEIDYSVESDLKEYVTSFILKLLAVYFIGIGIFKVIECMPVYKKLVLTLPTMQ